MKNQGIQPILSAEQEIISSSNYMSSNQFEQCLKKAKKRYDNNKLKLCPRGYCTAKNKFEVYPSAYANGYATSVCKGEKPDALGVTEEDISYTSKFKNKPKGNNSLNRWYKEQWVNLCEEGDGPGGYAVCGSGKGIDKPEEYPYCRPYYKLPGTTVVTAGELTDDEISAMCNKKRSLRQGVNRKPTRITLNKSIRQRVKQARQRGGGTTVKIPKDVQNAAQKGLKLLNKGFKGGTQTGWDRAIQLSGKGENGDNIDLNSLADMRTWFARHGPDAKNGGTSYPGYLNWLAKGEPENKNNSRGAVSWLIWGGDAAYLWLKKAKIRNILKQRFPNRKESSPENNLV